MTIGVGLVGDLLRIYSLFQTDGYHIMSSIRLLTSSNSIRVTGFSTNPTIPRINASTIGQHTQENWSMGIIDLDNSATGFTAYSPL